MADVKFKLSGDTTALDRLTAKVKTAGQVIKTAFVFRAGQAGFDAFVRTLRAAPEVIGSFVDAASDMQETLGKTDQIFGDAAANVVKWGGSAATLIGQSSNAAIAAAADFGNLFRSMGLTEQESAKMSTALVELASDLASFNNTSPEDAVMALGAGLRGEAEPLRRYGVLLDAATLKQKALDEGLTESTTDALEPATRALAAYRVILEQTTLAQGDFARTSDGLANSQRTVAAQVEDMKAVVGEGLLPVVQDLANFAATGIDWEALAGVPRAVIGQVQALSDALDGTPFGAIRDMVWGRAERDPRSEILDRMNAGRSAIDSREVSGSVFSRGDVDDAAREAAQSRMDLEAALREMITNTVDPAEQDEMNRILDSQLSRMERQEDLIRAITDEQIAANVAKREASIAEVQHAEAMKHSAAEYAKAQERFQAQLAAIDQRETAGMPIEDQIESLGRAEASLRESLNASLQTFHGDEDARGLAGVVEGAGNYAGRERDLEIVSEILKIEQRRAELLEKQAEDDREATEAREQASAALDEELAMLEAEISGNDEKLRQLREEAELRELIANLTEAGVEDPEGRAKDLVEARRRAEQATERRAELTGRLEDLKRESEGLTFQSSIGQVGALQRVGGGGGAVASGLDYQRQQADLQQQMVALLRELNANNPSRPLTDDL